MDTSQVKAATFPAHGNLLPALDGRVASLRDNPPRRAKARPTLRSYGCGLPLRATPPDQLHGVGLRAPCRQRIQAHSPSATLEVFLHPSAGVAQVVVYGEVQPLMAAVGLSEVFEQLYE